jgi:hypothetical protein
MYYKIDWSTPHNLIVHLNGSTLTVEVVDDGTIPFDRAMPAGVPVDVIGGDGGEGGREEGDDQPVITGAPHKSNNRIKQATNILNLWAKIQPLNYKKSTFGKDSSTNFFYYIFVNRILNLVVNGNLKPY